MRNPIRLYTHYALGLLLSLAIAVPGKVMGADWEQGKGMMVAKLTADTPAMAEEQVVLDKHHPKIKAVMVVQDRHARSLMALPEVVGTATGLTDTGRPAILVFTKAEAAPGLIPESVEGIPVDVKVTGKIFAMKGPAAVKIDPTARFASPMPIGISTGNIGECSAGTIGARVKKADGTVYALSNNHVYALENKAVPPSAVVQPGRYDTACSTDNANKIGELAEFVRIDFSGGLNKVDAAIAKVNYDPQMRTLGNATPVNGYGKPGSATVSASVGLAVQKYGRTSSLTKGSITALNATITVNYGAAGTATFENQVVVYSGKPFIKAGDSGSLLVTDPHDPRLSPNPVGLLFAGSTSGKYAFANPIEDVLNSFGVTIDDQ